MSIIAYKKGENVQLSVHFSLSEFECPCNKCIDTLVDQDLVSRLEEIRMGIGEPLKIDSGYRCSNYQAELRARGYETSTGISQHELGRAADIRPSDQGHSTNLESLARQVGFTSVGVGIGWVHVDLRPGYRRWEYTK